MNGCRIFSVVLAMFASSVLACSEPAEVPALDGADYEAVPIVDGSEWASEWEELSHAEQKEPEPVAILDAPPRLTTACTVLLGAVPLDGDQGGMQSSTVARVGDGLVFLRWSDVFVEGSGRAFDHTELSLAPIQGSGSLGAARLVTTLAERVVQMWTFPASDGVTVVYRLDEVPSSYGMVSADATGTVVVPPTPIPGLSGYDLSLFRRNGDGYAALCDDVVVRFDATGVQSEPKDKLFSHGHSTYVAAAEVSGGLMVVWESYVQDEGVTYQAMVLDADWRPSSSLRRVAVPDDCRGGGAVVAVDGGYLWAFDVDRGSDDATVVEVLRLDSDLVPVGVPHVLQAARDHVDCHEPRWAKTAGGLGLAWSCGHHYDRCGGCVATEVMSFAYLNPDDLTLASEPVEIKSGHDGGVFGRQFFEQGGDLVVAAEIRWHALWSTAVAAIHCEAIR